MYDYVTRVKSLACIEYLQASLRQAAEATGVSKSTLSRWSQEGYTRQTTGKRQSPKRDFIRQTVETIVSENPYVSIEEVRTRLEVGVSWSTVRRCMKDLRLSYKATCRTHKTHDEAGQG